MTKPTITRYLQQNSQMLGSLLKRLDELRQWNDAFRACLNPEDELLNHCQIVNLSKNALIVIADSPHWVTRMRFHIPELLPKLQKFSGLENIRAICCKVQPNYIRTKAKKKSPSKKISSNTAILIHEIANKMSDERLKTILKKIASHSSD